MAYEVVIRFTDPSTDTTYKQPFVVSPGETNTNKTSLALPGQGAAGYSQYLNNDLLRMLENFCSATAPELATRGQLWFDSAINAVKVCRRVTPTGSGPTYEWVTVGGVYVSTTPPNDETVLWYDISSSDSSEYQLKVFNPTTGMWTSVADRYVRKSGDALTGSLTFVDVGEGIVGVVGGSTNSITPTTDRGPALIGGAHAAIIINGQSAAPTGSTLVIGRNSTTPSIATDATNRLVTVSDSGTMTIHQNNLDLSGFKVTSVANGTTSSDAVNYGQLTGAQSALQSQIDQLASTDSTITTTLDNKVSKTGDTMSGALTINNNLVTSGTATIGSAASIGSTLAVSGATTLSSTLRVTSGTTLDTTLTVGGNATLSGVTIGGAAVLNSTLSVGGGASFSSAATFSNNITVVGTTSLSGLATLNQEVTAFTQAKHIITKAYADTKLPLTGGTITGNLTVTGSVNTGAGISVAGAIYSAGSITSPSNASFNVIYGAGLSVSGDVGGATLTIGGNGVVNGTFSAGSLYTGGALSVGSGATFGSSVTINNVTTLNAISSMNVDKSAITASTHLTTKQYVDDKVAAGLAGGGMALGWISFNGNGTVINSKNLYLSRGGAGVYYITLDSSIRSDANYTVVVGAVEMSSFSTDVWHSKDTINAYPGNRYTEYFDLYCTLRTASEYRLNNDDINSTTYITHSYADAAYITVAIFR